MEKVLDLKIRGLAFGGDGVGEVCREASAMEDSLLGITGFVPYTIPGETVEARLVEKKSRFIKASLNRVIEPSPSRVEAPCQYFTRCGGCQLQHISYEEQLAEKDRMVRGQFVAARVPQDVLGALQPIASSSAYSYRRRINLHIDSQGKIGFYQKGSRSLVEIDECLIADTRISGLIKTIKDLPLGPHIRAISLEADISGVVVVFKSQKDLNPSELKGLVEALREKLENFIITHAGRSLVGFGKQTLKTRLLGKAVEVPAGSFSQVNEAVNDSLVRFVAEHSKGFRSMLDLYSGAGNFCVPLSENFDEITAVESDTRLCRFLQMNFEKAKFKKTLHLVSSSVERFLKENPRPEADLVIADPPRNGLAKLAKQISFGKRLIFVSCDLPAFTRDLRSLMEIGWQVKVIKPFDMFAQTGHLEIAGVLDRA